MPGFSYYSAKSLDWYGAKAHIGCNFILQHLNFIIVMQLHIWLLSRKPRPFESSSQKTLRRWLALGCLIVPLGCTPYTHERLLRSGVIDDTLHNSGHFTHRLFRASATAANADKRLHIYIGGDGTPWRTPRLVAQDPTSRQSTMLKNMLQDDNNSVYVGRPCYYRVQDKQCRGNWWTHDRYHPEVVKSLIRITKYLAKPQQELWLIGHSGGGSLAVLIGRRLDRPVTVVTIGANLDHQAWTMHHDYSPLTGSLNPIDDPARNPGMQELHWYATEDHNILPKWILAYCQQHQASCQPVSGSHTSGWPSQWPELLQRSEKLLVQPHDRQK